jgi:hypothetical protein
MKKKNANSVNAMKLKLGIRSGDLELNEETALKFMLDLRGRYVLTKAMVYGLRFMEGEQERYKEYSDIDDIKYLVQNLELTKDFYFIIDEEVKRSRERRGRIL